MNRFILPVIAASTLIFGFVLPSGEAVAQTLVQMMAKDLVGTWTLVSVTLEKDGKKTDMYGPNPQGQLMFDPNGRISFMIIRSDLPKFASKNREAGTREENEAIVHGSLAYFGTYSADEAAKTVSVHVESCTFPNWNGIDRKYSPSISGDELQWAAPTSSLGSGTVMDVFKRAK